ncbi:Meckel syndrome type 1 protein, partial [Globisporangium splendens]
MPLTQYYHTRDPIENLRIHVTLRKTIWYSYLGETKSSSGVGDRENDSNATSNVDEVEIGTMWEHCFEWQEKKLSVLERDHQAQLLAKKIKKKKIKQASANEEEDEIHPEALDEDDTNMSAVLCSYIDADSYVPQSSNFEDDEAEKTLVLQRKLVLLEIASVQDLDADCSVFAEVNLRFPQNDTSQHDRRGGAKWKLRSPSATATRQTTSQAKTRTRTSLSNLESNSHGGTVAAFGKEEHGLKNENEESLNFCAVAPVLSFSIYSRDSWGRQRIEGFGELAIPPSSGHHDLRIPISKPISSVREELEEFFLGTDEHEDKVRQFSKSDTTSHNVNSRLGMQLQSTDALLCVRLNIVEQTPQRHPVGPLSQRCTGDSTASHSLHRRTAAASGLRVVKRSVHETLQTVKLEQRLSQPRDATLQAALGSMSTGGASAVSAILERLKTREQTSTSSI